MQDNIEAQQGTVPICTSFVPRSLGNSPLQVVLPKSSKSLENSWLPVACAMASQVTQPFPENICHQRYLFQRWRWFPGRARHVLNLL